MDYAGIDIGSTAAKVYVRREGSEDKDIRFVIPTGWSSRNAVRQIEERLLAEAVDVRNKQKVRTASTGYGRQAVDFADDVITEITCHGRGGRELAGGDCTVIDVGGQDTKVICLKNGSVADLLMNDKCAAGTGKFVEIMANRLNLDIPELFELAAVGTVIPISSLCTVFAESEVISFIGAGRCREDIAAGIADSVASKVASMSQKKKVDKKVILTGGLSQNPYFAKLLGEKLGRDVIVRSAAPYAGALGASLLEQEKHNRRNRRKADR